MLNTYYFSLLDRIEIFILTITIFIAVDISYICQWSTLYVLLKIVAIN